MKDSRRGGARPGAGRKKKYYEGYRPQLYYIEEELIAQIPKNKSEFVNQAIREKLGNYKK